LILSTILKTNEGAISLYGVNDFEEFNLKATVVADFDFFDHGGKRIA
jgi:hypothetical protein